MNIRNYFPWPEHRSEVFKRIPPSYFFLSVLAILLLALPPGVSAQERVLVNYTFIDENQVSIWDPPVRVSHYGLSEGLVAYHTDKTVSIWDSKTGGRETLEIPHESNYNINIASLDITDGTVYYVLDKKKGRTLFGSEGGLYAYDGKNNTLIAPFSRHDILNIIADDNRILVHDITNYYNHSDSRQDSAGDLFVFSPKSGEIIPVDDLIELSDPIGFGENNSVTATYGISFSNNGEMIQRLPGDGLAVFSLSGQPVDQTVTKISIPSGTNTGTLGWIVRFDPDCFSKDYFVWKKTTGNITSGYHSSLYLTDLRTLKNVILTETNGFFSDYSYAVDGDYLIFGRTLYHIPTGKKTELSFNGELDKLFDNGLGELLNNKSSEIDIIRFNDEGLLIRTYPKVEDADYSGKYQLFFADLGPVIHPDGKARKIISDTIPETAQQNHTKETPVSLMIPGLALIVVGIVMVSRNKK